MNVVIVTGDKDLFQLVCDSVKVYNPKDNGTWYDAAEVQKKFGVKPSQVVDVLALMGDASDNIKGVPGIGEKGARELITFRRYTQSPLHTPGTIYTGFKITTVSIGSDRNPKANFGRRVNFETRS